MTVEIVFVWIILVLVVISLIVDRIPHDASAMAGLLVLVIAGSLSPREALAGFSSQAVIAIAALLVLGAALERSGVVRQLADALYRISGDRERPMLLAGTLTPGLLSGVMNIIATVSVFIPVLLRMSLKTGRSPSRLLLPMAYVAMAGANLTLIGAAHNLVVHDLLRERTGTGFGFLEFLPVGLVMVALTLVYVLLTARWLLPERENGSHREKLTPRLIRCYEFSDRVWELEVSEDSPLVGSNVADLELMKKFGLSLISKVGKDRRRPPLSDDAELAAGDVLLVGGRRERVEALVEAVEGLELHGAPAHREDFSAGGAELIEVLVPPRSPAIGKTVRDLDLRSKADLTALALWRDGKPQRTDAETTELQAGDGLLLYGNKRYTRGFDPEPEFQWLHAPRKEASPPGVQRLAPWTLAIFILVIAVAALDWLPIAVAALAGALAVTLIGAVQADRAYERIDWRTLVLIAAMLPFATALNQSGASALLAGGLIQVFGQWGPLAVMGAVALVTLLLTQALHNAAAAAVMTPVALDTAQQLAVNPKTFAMAVVVAASMSVLLPAGHPAPLLVRRDGGYTTGDYLRFGAGMALLTLVVILVMVPWLWPFETQ